MSDDEQFRPHAYVCSSACVKRVEGMGTVNFTWLYQHRPPECRYGIAGQWSASTSAEQIVVFDMFHVMKRLDGSLVTPRPVGTHWDVDAAIMATAMLYGDESDA